MFSPLLSSSMPPNMTPVVQRAIEAENVSYFQQRTEEKMRKEISSMIKNIYPDQFLENHFVTILDYAIFRGKIKLCRYFVGDDKWCLPLSREIVPMLYKLANETGYEIFAEELRQILRNINRKNEEKLKQHLLSLNLFSSKGLTRQMDGDILSYLDSGELPLYSP